jgi:hypothetical protein
MPITTAPIDVPLTIVMMSVLKDHEVDIRAAMVLIYSGFILDCGVFDVGIAHEPFFIVLYLSF